MPSPNAPELVAYSLPDGPAMRIVPAPRTRFWMEATNSSFANRCLPLLIANQSGWFVLNDTAFRAEWDGTVHKSGLTILYASRPRSYATTSMFGHGILTFSLPFLFRTPPGYNLLARGPANRPKDGIAPLEGVIETDWAVATFTMNWQFTRPNHVVTFEESEPVCMLVPQRRGDLESFRPRLQPIGNDQGLKDAHGAWAASRWQFLTGLRMRGMGSPEPAAPTLWQKHYFQGTSPSGISSREHQRRLRLRSFEETPADGGASDPITQDARTAAEPPAQDGPAPG